MKSPAFRFYPGDFISSPTVQTMDLHEVGAYVLLLCAAWLSDRHAYLPNDEEKLRRLARMTRNQWEQSREILLPKFPVTESGWRSNPRLREEAEKQANFSNAQRKKAGKRWDAGAMPGHSQSDAGAMPEHPQSDAGGMPSVSVSVSKKNPSPAAGEVSELQLVTTQEEEPRAKASRSPREAKDPRHAVFRKHIELAIARFGAVHTWTSASAGALGTFLKKFPELTEAEFLTWLAHLEASGDEALRREPHRWIARLGEYAQGPVDKFGRLKQPETKARAEPVEDDFDRRQREYREAFLREQNQKAGAA